ncbi:CBS domain-containing protein [Streptomyces sp. NPDC059649]
MTDEVVSARSGRPVEDVARWLAEHGIDGLPVVDADDG